MFKLTPSIFLIAFVFGCDSLPEPPEDAVNERNSSNTLPPVMYTLQEGEQFKNQYPLPNLSKIELVLKSGVQSGQKMEAFRGWDFDHDGRFEMIEVLDANGKAIAWAYDFDGDGVIDVAERRDHLTKNKESDVTEALLPQRVP